MDSRQTLQIIFASTGLTVRKPDGAHVSTALPDLSQERDLLEQVVWLALPTSLPRSATDEERKRHERLTQPLLDAGGPEVVSKGVGKRLFEMIFPDEGFLEAYNSARRSGGMRLMLEFVLPAQGTDSEVSEWAVLPWEFLFDPNTGHYLAIQPDCWLVRRLRGGTSAQRFSAQWPLKVLALLAEPWNQARYGPGEARRSLVEALSGDQVQIRFEPQPTFPALIRGLAEQRPGVLHVLAHGADPSKAQGALSFEGAYGDEDRVPAGKLANQVTGSGVGLVVLDSCYSGSGEGLESFRGVTHALLRAGAPAVLAMQYTVPVVTGNRFCGELYRALSLGSAPEEAAATARRIVSGESKVSTLDWAIPVLYMQTDDWSITQGAGEATAGTNEVQTAPSNLGYTDVKRAAEFIGRPREMVEVAMALREPLQRRRFVTLTGMGGIGKTAAAAESAWWHWERQYFPEGVFWVSAEGLSYLQLLSRAGAALGIAEFDKAPQEEQEKALLSCLEHRQVLLVVDNADGLRDDTSFRGLLARISPNRAGRLLLTCRRRMGIDGEREVELPRLPLRVAASLFLSHWVIQNPKPKQSKEIAVLCGPGLLDGHPLAILIAASLAKKECYASLASLTAELQESITKTLRNRRTPEQEDSIEACLNVSYEALGHAAREMLVRLAIFDAPFRPEAVGAMAGEIPEWEQGKLELLEHHLLERREASVAAGGRTDIFAMHPVVRDYALSKVGGTKAMKSLHLQAGRFLVGTRYATEVVEGVKHLEAAEVWDEVIAAAWRIEDFLDRSGLWTDDEMVLQAGLRAAEASGQREQEGRFLGELGSNTLRKGDARTAIEYHEKALAIAREIGDRRGEGQDLGNLGNAYFSLGEVKKAIEYHEKALAIAREIGDRRGEGQDLGNAYFSLGEAKKAIEYYEQALAISREIGHRRGEGNHLGNLGRAYLKLGDHEDSLRCLLPSVAILDEVGSPDAKVVEKILDELRRKIGKPKLQALLTKLSKKTGS